MDSGGLPKKFAAKSKNMFGGFSECNSEKTLPTCFGNNFCSMRAQKKSNSHRVHSSPIRGSVNLTYIINQTQTKYLQNLIYKANPRSEQIYTFSSKLHYKSLIKRRLYKAHKNPPQRRKKKLQHFAHANRNSSQKFRPHD